MNHMCDNTYTNNICEAVQIGQMLSFHTFLYSNRVAFECT